MSFDSTLQLDGLNGPGGSSNNAFPIESFAFGATNPAMAATGGPAAAGKVSLSELSFAAVVSAASPELPLACEKGTPLTSGTRTASTTGAGPAGSTGLTATAVDNGPGDQHQFTGATGGGLPRQSISLAYQQIRVVWGSGTGGPDAVAGWDLTTNTAL